MTAEEFLSVPAKADLQTYTPSIGKKQGQSGRGNHPLLGKEYLFQWIDVNKTKQALYGRIIKDHRSTTGCHQFSILYEDASRELVNLSGATLKNFVPEQDNHIDEPMAWGGHFLAKRELMTSLNAPGHSFQPLQGLQWVVPRSMHDDTCRIGDGLFPRRTFMVHGFKVVLQAKPSEIEGGGLGVFITCTPVNGSTAGSKHFTLDPRMLIDLGKSSLSKLFTSHKNPKLFLSLSHTHKTFFLY